MNRSAFPIRIVGTVSVVILLGMLLVSPAGALDILFQGTETPGPQTPEPTARPTAEPLPYIDLNPVQGVTGVETLVAVSGGLWAAGHTVTLYWDAINVPLTQVQVNGDGTIQTTFKTPTDPALATVGLHTILARATNGDQADAHFELIIPTPTFTPVPTNTPPPTNPPPPTSTRAPTSTPTSTFTPIPTPTLRPVTPMVTITPIPPTKAPPPKATSTPRPTSTATPIPGTSTFTPTPSVTPTPTDTPGPGTPSATPAPTGTPTITPTAVEEISDTGGGWGMVFLWGGVLAGLLVVFRFLRVRGVSEQG